ncbi:aminoacylase-1-like [Chrysoperla carnea]|uniref:aminoacylase-1-like n=1 Tax=Chrysoperla carnea TaxID=189513 RepID=UPI001D0661E3|nr:aminoacylase-1-like [Chrysoperla carnea]
MSTSKNNTVFSKNESVRTFQEYLRIPSVQPNIDYSECINFLRRQADLLKLPLKIYEPVPKKPIVIISWYGSERALPGIILNSHMDVVPVFEDKWTYPPFSAHIDEKGNIFARGSQDMKCVGIQYLEAIKRLRKAGVSLRRTIHISFVPDEEIGGHDGMETFVKTADFRALNVGFALDEGMANPTNDYALFNGERFIWQILVRCPGTPGHGSLLLPNTAGEKLHYIIDKFMTFRAKQKARLESDPKLSIGDVTSINLTRLFGGVQNNVVPPELSVVFDIRLAVTMDDVAFEKQILQWCKEAGEGVTIEFLQRNNRAPVTPLDNTNPWWIAFKSVTDELKMNLKPLIFPGGTDSRYIREVGLPAIGFSPMNNTPVLLHDHDEFLNSDVFLRGIDFYEKLIPVIANIEERSG